MRDRVVQFCGDDSFETPMALHAFTAALSIDAVLSCDLVAHDAFVEERRVALRFPHPRQPNLSLSKLSRQPQP